MQSSPSDNIQKTGNFNSLSSNDNSPIKVLNEFLFQDVIENEKLQFIKKPNLLNLEDQKDYILKSNDLQQLRDARHIEWWLNHNDSN